MKSTYSHTVISKHFNVSHKVNEIGEHGRLVVQTPALTHTPQIVSSLSVLEELTFLFGENTLLSLQLWLSLNDRITEHHLSERQRGFFKIVHLHCECKLAHMLSHQILHSYIFGKLGITPTDSRSCYSSFTV